VRPVRWVARHHCAKHGICGRGPNRPAGAPSYAVSGALLLLSMLGGVEVQAAEAEGVVSGASEAVAGAADVAVGTPAAASDLLDRAYKNLYAEDYIQTLVLATQSRGGNEMKRRLQITRRQSVRPGKALLRFLYPQTIRRTSVLILENENASDDLYVYLPAVRITRHLSNAQRADSFFGTDLSYEDVEPKYVEDYRTRFLAPDEQGEAAASAEKLGCRLIEITAAPGFESAYEKQISCIEPERAIIAWTDFYVRGRVLKRLTIDASQIQRIGDRYIPWLITVETPRQRSVTRVITEDYDMRAKIPDKLFNTWNLAAGDAKSDRSKTEAVQPVDEAEPASAADELQVGE
jgi:hypothetical protein